MPWDGIPRSFSLVFADGHSLSNQAKARDIFTGEETEAKAGKGS